VIHYFCSRDSIHLFTWFNTSVHVIQYICSRDSIHLFTCSFSKRVLFPFQVQLTDFENAAFATFVVLITRVILSFNLNLLIPLSKVKHRKDLSLLSPLYSLEFSQLSLYHRWMKIWPLLKSETLSDKRSFISGPCWKYVSFNNDKNISKQWVTGGMENSGIFKTMKRQWNILITGSWLDGTFVMQFDFLLQIQTSF
jgi:hypothetical protein